MSLHNAIRYPVGKIRRLIGEEGQTQQQVADLLAQTLDPRVTAKLIQKVCKKHGIHCQRSGPRSGPGHPDWKGGRTVTREGYVKVYCPDHPSCIAKNLRRAAKANGKYYAKEKYVLEHRLVVEKIIQRPLRPEEVIHHKGARDDNRVHQLVPFGSNAAHLRKELAGKVPHWSAGGVARIQAGVAKARTTYHQRKVCGVPTPHKKRSQ